MKKSFIVMVILLLLVCSMLLFGCDRGSAPPSETNTLEPPAPEKIAADFQAIIENNCFYDITAFEGRLLKAESVTLNGEDGRLVHRIRMMDTYGNSLAAYDCDMIPECSVSTLTATDDGGFLFVLGFRDRAYPTGGWASDHGYASHVIKCTKDGALQFDTPLESVEGAALGHCIEKDGYFYLFGTRETPETQIAGVYSPTDVYMAILDQQGRLIKNATVAGLDYDRLHAVESIENGFRLSVSSQSDDGDFLGSDSNGYPADWLFCVDHDLKIVEGEQKSGRSVLDRIIGERDGVPIYQSDFSSKDSVVGSPSSFIDYSSFYLVVSERVTGTYENTPPMISSIWHYTETVYSFYDNDGNLIFRDAVDSSPDFDAMSQRVNGES